MRPPNHGPNGTRKFTVCLRVFGTCEVSQGAAPRPRPSKTPAFLRFTTRIAVGTAYVFRKSRMNSAKQVNAPLSGPDTAQGRAGSPGAVELPHQPTQSLLETIRRIRARAGDALADDELTFFLQRWDLPEEEGFTFLCFRDGCITLAVPAPDKSSRHPRSAWITPAKERIAADLARKHGLFVCEPPDAPPAFVPSGAWETHHHLRLSNRKETIVIAYPEFLKVRLYATGTNLDLHLAPDLLKDLSALYKEG